jgi:hypothetical protein
MDTETQRRELILKKISRIPKEKLGTLEEFISKLEKSKVKKARKISFAGAWSDLDEATFKSFTDDLIENRQKNRRRINEYSLKFIFNKV